jgi:hypothetical protein
MRNKMKKIGKRAQIPETLTWFVAFLIIFFIMVLFISGTIVISSRKKASADRINPGEHVSSLKAQRYAINLLNSKIDGKSFEDYIKEHMGGSYKELYDYAVDHFKKGDLLWRIYVPNPSGGYEPIGF